MTFGNLLASSGDLRTSPLEPGIADHFHILEWFSVWRGYVRVMKGCSTGSYTVTVTSERKAVTSVNMSIKSLSR